MNNLFLIVATLLWESVRMRLTLPKWGLGSPPRLSKLQSLIVRVKTPCIDAFFISLENYQSVGFENGLAWTIWIPATQVMVKRRVGSQFDSRPLKVGNRLNPGACRWSATHHWKALNESYKLLHTSSQSKVWAKNYALAKLWESKPR
jgi:hypothetical protein